MYNYDGVLLNNNVRWQHHKVSKKHTKGKQTNKLMFATKLLD